MTRTAPLLATAMTWPMANAAPSEGLFPATLAGHAMIPAMTLIAPPADAPKDAMNSGKFTGPARNEVAGSLMGDTGASDGKRATGISLPFEGHPLQGMSGFALTRAQSAVSNCL